MLKTLLIVTAAATVAQANPLKLADGVFHTATKFCAERIINDESTGHVVVATGSDCRQQREVSFARVSDSSFAVTFSNVLTEDDVKTCAPTASDKKPCQDFLYDKNGQLLYGAGDTETETQTLSILNSNAFHQHDDISFLHGTTVLVQAPAEDPVLFIRQN